MPQRKLLLSFRNIVKKILITILTIFLICLVVGIIFASFLIKIKNLECLTQYGDCSKDISEKIESYKGYSLYSVRSKIKLILNNEKSVSKYALQFKLPDILRIDLLIKKPIYCIKTSDKFLLTSDSGQIISIGSECNLPRINVNFDKGTGDYIGDTNLYALKIMQGIYEIYQVEEGVMTKNTLTVKLNPDLTVIFPVGSMDPAAMLGALRLIYTKIENEGSNFSEIDLRFENPVLR